MSKLQPYTELSLNYRISTSGPVPWIWLKECDIRFFVNSTKWNLFLKSLDYWPGELPSKWSKTRSWKFKIQTKGLLKIKHLVHDFNLMDFLVLKIELAVTLILQYLKTFNWSQCMSGKERFKYPLSWEKRIIKNPHPMRCDPSDHPASYPSFTLIVQLT